MDITRLCSHPLTCGKDSEEGKGAWPRDMSTERFCPAGPGPPAVGKSALSSYWEKFRPWLNKCDSTWEVLLRTREKEELTHSCGGGQRELLGGITEEVFPGMEPMQGRARDERDQS